MRHRAEALMEVEAEEEICMERAPRLEEGVMEICSFLGRRPGLHREVYILLGRRGVRCMWDKTAFLRLKRRC